MGIPIRNIKEIKCLEESNQIVARTIAKVASHAKVGTSLIELDAIAEDFIHSCDAKAAFKGLYGFPKSICLSLNSVIIHGVPSEVKLKEGDILGIDIGIFKNGWYGDAASTIPIGNISAQDTALLSCSKDALDFITQSIKAGMRFKEISKMIQDFIHSRGFVPLRNYCGHGIGRRAHEDPQIPNYIEFYSNSGPKVKNGMVFCIEPMICQRSGNPIVLEDGWSVVSEDGLNGAHHENAMAIIDNRAVILSKE